MDKKRPHAEIIGRRSGKRLAYYQSLALARALGCEVEEYPRAGGKASYAIIRPPKKS